MRISTVEDLVVIASECVFLALLWQAYLLGDMTRLFVVLVSMVLAVVPVLVERGMHIHLPPGVKSVIVVTLLLNAAGGVLRWYWVYKPWYDKVAHFVAGTAIGLLAFVFFLFLDRWDIRVRRGIVLSGIVIIVLLLGLSWEVSEVYIDTLGYSTYSNGITDNIQDMVANTFGSIVAVLYALRLLSGLPPGGRLSALLSGSAARTPGDKPESR